MRVLVTGGSGLVGTAVVKEALARGHHTVAVARDRPTLVPEGATVTHADLTAPDACAELLKRHAPDVVVHAAAMTDVNACEKDPARAFLANAWAPARLADSARNAGVTLIHVSTHAVFSGLVGGETETDAPAPCNAYALTKAAGEDAVLARGGLVVRIMPVGNHAARPDGRSFGEWLLRSIRTHADLRLFADARFNPTTPARCADFFLHLAARRPAPGIFHLGSRDVVSKADVALGVLGDARDAYNGNVSVVNLADVDVGAPRPRESWVSTADTRRRAGYDMPEAAEVVDLLRRSMRSGEGTT